MQGLSGNYTTLMRVMQPINQSIDRSLCSEEGRVCLRLCCLSLSLSCLSLSWGCHWSRCCCGSTHKGFTGKKKKKKSELHHYWWWWWVGAHGHTSPPEIILVKWEGGGGIQKCVGLSLRSSQSPSIHGHIFATRPLKMPASPLLIYLSLYPSAASPLSIQALGSTGMNTTFTKHYYIICNTLVQERKESCVKKSRAEREVDVLYALE